jgi:hypothetical protein
MLVDGAHLPLALAFQHMQLMAERKQLGPHRIADIASFVIHIIAISPGKDPLANTQFHILASFCIS